ncbi:Bifunctional purine biosynthesis protein PurH [Spiromyces aspiralis]|uniref:Bifunctional purine biosynthesis protein PurH n=1 Tax=Spiromyces aspiralis TaxID=68401 RepID=A0ACC1HJ85_9FUNG|nr:Bifunctional purine biosynthesis protein PurH [Spiromyces aspiralis]
MDTATKLPVAERGGGPHHFSAIDDSSDSDDIFSYQNELIQQYMLARNGNHHQYEHRRHLESGTTPSVMAAHHHRLHYRPEAISDSVNASLLPSLQKHHDSQYPEREDGLNSTVFDASNNTNNNNSNSRSSSSDDNVPSTRQSWYCIMCGLIVLLAPLQYGYKLAELNSIHRTITDCDPRDTRTGLSPAISPHPLPHCLPMSDVMFGLVTSMFAVGGLAGALASGHVANKLGRAGGLRWNNAGLIAGSVLEGLSVNPAMLMLGRLLVGFSSALSIVLAPMYLAEIATEQRRGMMTTLNQTAIVTGLLTAQVLGYWLNSQPYWRVVVGVGAFVSTVHAMLMLFVTESPKYLFTTGYMLDAKLALLKLRDRLDTVDAELAQWAKPDTEGCNGGAAADTPTDIQHRHVITIFNIWRRPEYRFVLLMIAFLQLSQQFSGINMVFFYSSSVLSALVGVDIANLLVIFLGVINVVFTFLGNYLVDRMDRRTLLLGSMIAMMVSQLTLALGVGLDRPSMAAVALFLVVASFAPGFGPLPFLLTTELFPTVALGAGSSYSISANWVGAFLIALGFPPLQAAIGAWVFVVFLVSLAVGSAVVYAYLPETRGRSGENIAWGLPDL